MSAQIGDFQAPMELNSTTQEFRKQSKKSYTRDFLLSFTELDICKELPSEFDRSILQPSKILYTRDFLLSLSELESCRRLPIEFSPSILGEFLDASDSILQRQRTPGIVLPLSSKYGSSPFTRGEYVNISKGLCGNWHGLLSELKNGESRLEGGRDSDTGRRYSHQSQRSWKIFDHDALLECGAFPRVSRCAGEDSAPKIQENSFYQLNKSANPYRPPHSYKEIPNSGRESNDSSTEEAFDSVEPSNEKRTEEEERRRASLELMMMMRNEQQRATQEKQKQIGAKHEEYIDPLIVALLLKDSRNDKRFVNESEESMESDSSLAECSLPTQNHTRGPFVHPGLTKQHQNVEADKTIKHKLHSSEFARLFPEEAQEKKPADTISSLRTKDAYGGSNGLITENSFSTFSSVTNELASKPVTSTLTFGSVGISEQFYGNETPEILARDFLEQLNSANDEGSSLHYSSFLDKGGQFSELIQESINKHLVHKLGSVGNNLNLSAEQDIRQSQNSQTHEPDFETGLAKDFHSNEASAFVQRGSVDGVSGTNISEVCGFSFPLADDILIGSTNFYEQSELEKMNVKDSYFDDDWAEIESILRTHHELEDSPVSCCDDTVTSIDDIIWPDEDSLIAFEDPIIPQHSNLMPKITSILQAEQDPKLSPEHEICLPDEDSLITVDDLVFPRHSASLSGGDSLKSDGLASSMKVDISGVFASLNIAKCDDRYPVLGVEVSPVSGSCEVTGLGSRLNPNQAQISTQIKSIDPKTICSSPLYSHFRTSTNPRPFLKTYAKPKRFDNTVQYSVLQQPISFSPYQRNELLRGAALPNPIYQMPSYMQDLNPVHIVPLNCHQPSYEGFGMPNPDHIGVGRYNYQAAFNKFTEMELEALSFANRWP